MIQVSSVQACIENVGTESTSRSGSDQSLKNTISTLGLQYFEAKGKEAMEIDKRSLSAVRVSERVERMWFSYLEAKNMSKEWSKPGPPIGK